MGKYDDIINSPRPQLSNHKPLSMTMRAAQFAPFAALSGYASAIDEEQRVTHERVELTPHELERLSRRLEVAMGCDGGHPELSVTWFRPDMHKSGGAYITSRGRVRGIDTVGRRLVMAEGATIALADIMSIDGEMFADYPDLD